LVDDLGRNSRPNVYKSLWFNLVVGKAGVMDINVKSWHYKMNKCLGDGTMPKTLCSYFWISLWHIFMILTMLALGLLLITFFISPIFLLLTTNEQLTGMGYASISIDTMILIMTGGCCLLDKISFSRVIIEYIKAVKNKVCPLITYKEQD
jgi:hypothetical protein